MKVTKKLYKIYPDWIMKEEVQKSWFGEDKVTKTIDFVATEKYLKENYPLDDGQYLLLDFQSVGGSYYKDFYEVCEDLEI